MPQQTGRNTRRHSRLARLVRNDTVADQGLGHVTAGDRQTSMSCPEYLAILITLRLGLSSMHTLTETAPDRLTEPLDVVGVRRHERKDDLAIVCHTTIRQENK